MTKRTLEESDPRLRNSPGRFRTVVPDNAVTFDFITTSISVDVEGWMQVTDAYGDIGRIYVTPGMNSCAIQKIWVDNTDSAFTQITIMST